MALPKTGLVSGTLRAVRHHSGRRALVGKRHESAGFFLMEKAADFCCQLHGAQGFVHASPGSGV
jgi:hypothetical protein